MICIIYCSLLVAPKKYKQMFYFSTFAIVLVIDSRGLKVSIVLYNDQYL